MTDFVGGTGDDIFTGGINVDTATGNGGNDTLAGGSGADILDGGDGNDWLYSANIIPVFTLPYYDSRSYIPPIIDPTGEQDVLRGGGGNDYIFAGYGDNVDGGANDSFGDYLYISFLAAPTGITFDGGLATQVVGGATITGIENISFVQGSNFADTINGASIGSGYSEYGALLGMGGNDTIVAGYYTGTIFGGDGNDIIDGRPSSYLRDVYGDDGDDTIYTNNYSFAFGGAGNDTIYAHATVFAGSGNDLIILQPRFNSGHAVFGESGDDEVHASTSGDIVFGGDGADRLSGNTGDDTFGSAGASSNPNVPDDDLGVERDIVTGGDGNDLVSVGIGDDADGGADFDTLHLSLAGASAGVNFFTQGITGATPFVYAGGTIVNFEDFTSLRGSEFNDQLVIATQASRLTIEAGGGGDVVVASQSSVTVNGGAGDDQLTGSSVTDTLSGSIGDDRLDGGAGADQLYGGAGDDHFIVDNIGDQVFEIQGEGTDTVESSVSFSLVGSAVENLTLTGDAAINGTGNALNNNMRGNVAANTLYGGGGNDVLDGGAGGDRLYGGAGDDRYVIDNSLDRVTELDGEGTDTVESSVSFSFSSLSALENLTLTGIGAINGTGNALNNILIGNAAANILDGSTGVDTMQGGGGNDTYYVDVAGDIVLEGAGAGNDTVLTARSYALTAGQEIETLATANDAGTGFINLTGNEFDNILRGNAGGNRLDGGLGADQMAGGLGNDPYGVDNVGDQVIELSSGGTDSVESSVNFSLEGSAVENLTLTGSAAINGTGNALANILIGNTNSNILDGGSGADLMEGGAGDDIYYVDNASDVIREAIHGGNDSVFTSISFALPAGLEIEYMAITRRTGTDAIDLTGNELANRLIGNAGANRLEGGAGNDQLLGFAGNDQLYGGVGSDTLFGDAGSDQLYGGTGDDYYLVDDANDTIVELAGEGNDSILADVSITLTADQEIEAIMAGSGSDGDLPINLTGNGYSQAMSGNGANNVLSGLGGNDVLSGQEGADTLYGGDGNDTLDGGLGGDRMYGGTGDDRYVIDNSLDRVTELDGEGTDLVESSVSFSLAGNAVENLTLTGSGAINGTGNALDNRLVGNAAANILDGGLGVDQMQGGAGNDIYYVDVAGDFVFEAAGGGNDTVLAARSYTLVAGQEIETLATANDAGTGFINLTGNEFDNILRGNAGGNRLDGALGADQMAGGLGNDTYVVDNAGDQITELSGGGTDSVESSISFSLANAPEVENLTLTGVAALNATGNGLANILTGNAAANQLFGGSGNDTLYGGDGEDLLDGGLGADRLYGGAGNDRYIVDDSGDQVFEVNAAGIDMVESSVNFSLNGLTALENLTLTGSAAINGTGNDLANELRGNSGNNQLDGGLGADSLYGEAGNDILMGGAGNDILTGGTGLDQMSGGAGDDRFIVDNVGDQVFEDAGNGTDIVESSVTFTLTGDVENLTLTGVAAITGTGNALNNNMRGNVAANTLYGGGGNDVLDGGAGGDRLYGGAGDDRYIVDNSLDRVTELDGEGTDTIESSVSFSLAGGVENLTLTGIGAINGTGNTLANILIGNAAANILDGGLGVDTMQGGAGDDIYYVDVAGDIVLEGAGGGNDTVLSARTYALAAGQEIETLATANDAGTGFINLTGNEFANTLRGNAGGNILDGGAGDDTLFGGDGNDTLNGGAGFDALYGGKGNDRYVVIDNNDSIFEFAGEGIDSVETSVYFSLGGISVENLTITGTSEVSANGNELDNILIGNMARNVLLGYAGNDQLFGGGGDDSLWSGIGIDQLYGGSGDDLYTVDDPRAMIFERAGEGDDAVFANVSSYTLATGQEIEWLWGYGGSENYDLPISLTGNEYRQIIHGNVGNDILSGLGGNDTLFGHGGSDTLLGGDGDDILVGDRFENEGGNNRLSGGAGNDEMIGGSGIDSFVFDTALGANNVDKIDYVQSGIDHIELDRSIFTALGLGTLSSAELGFGSAATTAAQRILYDSSTGNLSYDADGSGADAAVVFAHIDRYAGITSADFLVVP